MKSTESLMINSNDFPLTAKKYPKLRSSVTAPPAFRDIFDQPGSLFSVAARRSMVCPTASRPMRVTAP